MSSIWIRSAIACLALSVGGCASYQWVKPGASQQEFSRDRYECQAEAARLFTSAYIPQQISSGYVSPSSTYCNGSGSAYGIGNSVYDSGSTSCTTYPGQAIAPVSIPVDVNTSSRREMEVACMYARGWSRVKVTEVREETTRVLPLVCEIDAHCAHGQSCRSRKGGGTECR